MAASSTAGGAGVLQFIRFFASGAIGTCLFYVVYEALYATTASWLPHPAGLCWSLAYFLSILWQHALHRWLVFGSDGNYWKSLLYTYACYSLSIVLSGVLNDALVEYFHVDHQWAWGLTLGATGALNYFTLRNAFAPEHPKDEAQPKKAQ